MDIARKLHEMKVDFRILNLLKSKLLSHPNIKEGSLLSKVDFLITKSSIMQDRIQEVEELILNECEEEEGTKIK